MKKIGFLAFLLIAVLVGKYLNDRNLIGFHSSNQSRTPSKVNSAELVRGSQQVLSELNNPSLFNINTCESYVSRITDYMYNLPAEYFIPRSQTEVDLLRQNGPSTLDTIFQIRVTLNQKLKEFDSQSLIPKNCVNKIREGYQYARFAEEYLLDWLYSQKVFQYSAASVLDPRIPNTWTNPKFTNFQLKTGDILLVRGKSYVSAMIARIGDEEGNFSHLAMIAEDRSGNKYVVEALIQTGTIVTPLEKWLKQESSRVALYRFLDEATAKKAGQMIYDKVANNTFKYDFAMNDSEHSAFFCSEVIRYAYELATLNRVIVPKYRSSLTKFKDSAYPKALGITASTLFAPYDIEVDPRFELVAEFRHFPLLRQVRMQDAVLQSIYGWMIEKDYSFNWSLNNSAKAYLAKIVRYFGIAADALPSYMPIQTLQTTIQFEAVAKSLEKNLYDKEAEFYKANGYLPSFQDMIKINEEFRLTDCKTAQANKTPVFHFFFHPTKNVCE